MSQCRRHVLPGGAQGDEAQEMPSCTGRRLHAEQDVRRSELFGLDGYDTERPGSPARQYPGGGVGVIPQGGDCALDPAAGARRPPRGTR